MTARTAASKKRTAKRARSPGVLAALLQLFVLTYFGRIIFALLIFTLVVLLDLLVSGNKFDLFFRILGIELVLTAVFFWLRLLLKKD